jgi:uncharacterized protein YqeY
MRWIDGKQHPLDDSDCLVIYQRRVVNGFQRALRAPVFWHADRSAWIDEYGNELDVVKYVLILELDDGTIHKSAQ